MIRLLTLLFVLALAPSAWAQPVGTAFVVSSCGGATYTAGHREAATVDTTGNWCTNGTGGGGGAVTQGTTPWVDSVTTWGGGTLGAMANYGTSPGAVLVPGVNAFITNTPTVTANAGTNLNTSALALETGGNLATLAGTVASSKVNINISSGNPTTIQPIPATTGGMSVFTKQVANNTTSFAVDASAGTLYGISAFNNSATIAYLKLYNTAQGSVTCGTPTPVDRMLIPANTSGAGFIWNMPLGVAYGTAITACVTTGFADNDTSAPAASTYLVSFYYK